MPIGPIRATRFHGAVNGFAVVGAIGRDRGDGAGDLIEQRADQGGVTLLDGGQLGGKDSPLLGSTTRWSLRQVRWPRSPCFSLSHSPAPYTFRPVESITT